MSTPKSPRWVATFGAAFVHFHSVEGLDKMTAAHRAAWTADAADQGMEMHSSESGAENLVDPVLAERARIVALARAYGDSIAALIGESPDDDENTLQVQRDVMHLFAHNLEHENFAHLEAKLKAKAKVKS